MIRKEEKEVLSKEMVFLIGASRSGTTWLHSMLGHHPRICAPAELMLFNFYTQPWMESWDRQVALQRTSSDMGLPHLWSREEFQWILKDFVSRVYDRASRTKPGADILVDKHPGYSNCVDHINDLFPDCRFIHLIRDGRDVAASLLAASRDWAKLWAPQDVEGAGWTWVREVRGALEAAKFGNRYLEIRYEDLLDDDCKILGETFGFMGIQVDDSTVRTICRSHSFEKMKKRQTQAYEVDLPAAFFRKGGSGNWRESFSGVDRFILNTQVGQLLNELGYADEFWWAESKFDRIGLPLFSIFGSKPRFSQRMRRATLGLFGRRIRQRIRSIVHSGSTASRGSEGQA